MTNQKTDYATIPDVVIDAWNNQTISLITMLDVEQQVPITHAISWVCAPNDRHVRLALDARSVLGRYLLPGAKVNVATFAGESFYVTYGKVGRIVALEQVPFALHCIEIVVDAVREAMYYGAKIATSPVVEKTYDARAAKKLDDQVFAALEKA